MFCPSLNSDSPETKYELPLLDLTHRDMDFFIWDLDLDLSIAGLCYNELECLAGGGSISGYCAPAALGVCCVFRHSGCGRTVKQRTAYFTNPNYPLKDRKPIACLLKEVHISKNQK